MAIAVTVEFDGATLDDYDKVLGILGYRARGTGESGGLFHWVTETDTGIRVTDVWTDMESFERFAEAKLRGALEEAGIEGEPRIATFPVHNYLTAG